MIDDLVAAIHALHEQFVQLQGELADTKARMERMNRDGTVSHVDAAKQRVRVQIGKDADGTPHLTPWIPYSQFAGANSLHMVPSVGQQMHVISPDGDHEQARAYPLTWSKQNKSPSSDKDSVVSNLGGVKSESKGGTQTITGNLVVTGTVTIKGDLSTEAALKNKNKSVGADHKHDGVQGGGDQSGTPV